MEAGAKAEAEALMARTQAAENFMVTDALEDMKMMEARAAKRWLRTTAVNAKIEVDVRGYATRKTRHQGTSVRLSVTRSYPTSGLASLGPST